MRIVLAVVTTWMIAGGAAAQSLGAQELDRGQLTAARGQLVTGGGLTFGFGARVRTYVDGALSLESTLALTDQGLVKSTVEPAAPATSGEAGASDEAAPGASTAAPARPVALSGAAAAAGGINLPGVNPADVVVLPGDGGATALLQTLTADQISNVVLNTANNRDVRQEVDLTFVLPGFAETQALSSLQALRSNLQSALDQALTQ